MVSSVRTDNGQSMGISKKNMIDEELAFRGLEEFFEEPDLPESVRWVIAS